MNLFFFITIEINFKLGVGIHADLENNKSKKSITFPPEVRILDQVRTEHYLKTKIQ